MQMYYLPLRSQEAVTKQTVIENEYDQVQLLCKAFIKHCGYVTVTWDFLIGRIDPRPRIVYNNRAPSNQK